MVRISSIALFARTLLFATVFVLASNGKSYAQEADVRGAIDAFHGALEALDVAKMESLWIHDDRVILITPVDKSISVGWDAVKKKWAGAFEAFGVLKAPLVDGPHISVKGDVAWATGIASATEKLKSGVEISTNALTYESYVFEKRDGQWLLVSHVALRVPK